MLYLKSGMIYDFDYFSSSTNFISEKAVEGLLEQQMDVHHSELSLWKRSDELFDLETSTLYYSRVDD